MAFFRARKLWLFFVVLAVLGGCTPDAERPESWKDETERQLEKTGGSILGSGAGGNFIFGGPEDKDQGGGSGIGVNAFLWRAALDTLSFMPLASADPFGGVILTDWYSDPGNLSERIKVNVFILGRSLRSDGLRAAVFRQVLDNGVWVDALVDPDTATKLEDTILTRAREIRVGQNSGQ